MLALTLLTASLAFLASASPLKRAGPTDVEILNYALTLEYLEAAFYKGALAKFNAAAFKKAGYPSWVRGRFEQIAEHEAEHVTFLAGALGDAATKACEYSFPYTDPKSFVALSSVLENGGVSAYLGAAQFITTKAYLTAAGSILTTEARHQGWVNSAVAKQSAWSKAFDTPLDFDQIYSIVAPFITSCPSSNPALPAKAFPAASFTLSGKTLSLTFTPSSSAKGPYYLALYSGLDIAYYKISDDKKVTLPAGLQGTIFGVITTSGSAIDDSNTVAGPVILSFPFDSFAKN